MAGFVVVKGRFGMGGRIAVLISAWRYALDTNRELVVDWNDFSYYDGSVDDLFTHLFGAPSVSSTPIEDLVGRSVWPPRWKDRLLSFRNDRAEEVMPYELSFDAPPGINDSDASEAEVVVVTRNSKSDIDLELYDRLLLSPVVAPRVHEARQQTRPEEAIGVQIRHGNGERMLAPPNLDWFHDRLDVSTPIFLATDSCEVLEQFLVRYPDVRHQPKWYAPVGGGSLHQNDACVDRVTNAIEALVDIWLLAECRSLLICKGFFGETARRLSPQLPYEQYPGRIHPTAAAKREAGWVNPI